MSEEKVREKTLRHRKNKYFYKKKSYQTIISNPWTGNLYQEISEETFLPKMFEERSLPKIP